MKTIIDFLTQLEKAGLDAKDVEAFSELSSSEKARITATIVAVMKLPSDSGQTVVMRPPPAQQGKSRKAFIVNNTAGLPKVECSVHREWPIAGVVSPGTEMYLGEIGDVGPTVRLAAPAEMLWFLAVANPSTSFIGERVEVHGKGYQLRLKLKGCGSWTQEFGTEGDGHLPALLVKVGEDFTI